MLAAFQAFYEREQRPPRYEEAKADPEIPHPSSVFRMFGSWSNGLIAAGIEPRGQGWNAKDDENAQVYQRVERGELLKDISRELGITPQVLGRRLKRYCQLYDRPYLTQSGARKK